MKNPDRRKDARKERRIREQRQIKELEERVYAFDERGSVDQFADLPLSQQTQDGLKKAHFTVLTDIQKKALPLALKGNDVLGAAKTGSGKTLAFIIPILEMLLRKQWTQYDGLGALIISPTRELVLRKVGSHHTFSAGLLIGGKSLAEEQSRLETINILVCTPGRLLQHMDQTASFRADTLQLLVLDEADRILDMGFRGTVDGIIQHLPRNRQTLLFSATQTSSLRDLARLSLKDPKYVAVHEGASESTPEKLKGFWVECPLPQKLNTLYAFIKANLKTKALVFMSSTKQVRFVYETFRHLQPGVPLLHLHGKQKQSLRASITQRFSSANHAYLFCTDVVARGLDFPLVDWVIQLDCPEDTDTYIHRVGRTARFERSGQALMILLPSETAFIEKLAAQKVPIQKFDGLRGKAIDIKQQLNGMCFKNPEIKYLGQKAFSTYVRSVFLQKDKQVFKVEELPQEDFAHALGLPTVPHIKLGKPLKQRKNQLHPYLDSASSSEDDRPSKTKTKTDKMFSRQNQTVLTKHYQELHSQGNTAFKLPPDKEDDDLLTTKRKIDWETAEIPGNGGGTISKRQVKIGRSRKALAKRACGRGTRLTFDDEGNAHPVYELVSEKEFLEGGGGTEEMMRRYVEETAKRMRNVDEDDREEAKEKKRLKRLKKSVLESV